MMHTLEKNDKPSIILRHCKPENIPYFVWMAGTLGRAFSGIGQPPVMGVIAQSLVEEGLISADAMAILYFLSIIGAATTMPLAGYFFDRYGARKTGVSISLVLSIICFLFAYSGAHKNIYSLFLIFFFIRCFATGALMLVSSNMINQWWTEKRRFVQGLSSGIYSLFMFAIFPPLVLWLEQNYGRQHMLGTLGISTLCIMVPVCYFFYVHDKNTSIQKFSCCKSTNLHLFVLQHQHCCQTLEPIQEDTAYWSADDTEETSLEDENSWEIDDNLLQSNTKQVGKEHFTFQAAMKCKKFWKLTWVCFTWGFFTTAIFFHLSVITKFQITSNITVIFWLIGLFATTCSLIPSYTLSYIDSVKVLGVVMLLLGISLVFISLPLRNIILWCFAVTLGVVMGLMNVFSIVLFAEWYGTADIGKIAGVNQAITQFGSALGPIVFRWILQNTETQHWITFACSFWPFLSAVLYF